MHTPADTDFMRQALALAEAAIGLTDPNPRVGCVIVGADGHLLGRGHTQEAGGPHAEMEARLMVNEKAIAFTEAATTAAAGGSAHKIVRRYRTRVRANAKRLSRAKS